MAVETLYQEVDSGKLMDLDEILGSYGLGRYQVTVCALMGLVLMYSNISPLSYAITAADVKYRCEIPECEDVNDFNKPYNTSWFKSAIPPDNENVDYQKCFMYPYIGPQNSSTENNTKCASTSFSKNASDLIECKKWVFEDTEKTIVTDFSNIMCDENKWKLSMVGTINSIGQFIGIPLSGFISDKYGRKFIVIIGSVSSAILGTMRSFTNGYLSFILFEFLDSVASSGVYGATFVLGLELVSPKARVTASTIMGCFYPMGAVIMGFVAYMVLDWKIMLRIVYLPGLLILGYTWYVPESMRWLQTQNRIEEMTKILSKVAKSNGKALPPSVREALASNPSINNNLVNENKLSFSKLMEKIFDSKEIFLRLINCSFCWVSITSVYYGLSLASIEFYGNRHLNFMLVNAIEVPAFLTSWYFMEHFPRRYTQAGSFLLSGICCISTVNIIPDEYAWIRLILFLGSKFAITMSFNTIYVFTAEMFPTELRMSLFGIASMFGRLGSMIAPQIIFLATIFGKKNVPIVLFGCISFVAGGLAFLFPETKNQKLPDTIKQAEFINP
ncbi:Sugar transporter, conserved site,Major facilitator superfamily domain,Major facilitator, sugar [Cinara cedri]|uniref:Sugar transporter, conserved site,Major facilitator superfamily domain,Major facilitator, sugar n=1 Tax=Cinara cedri TaxID=506608 RepID=A0A5E4MRU5_9HEMI|nr:Sugar transporter, conserved site,Major facilitator superfamily domain,Major facilitator, sugar [Cinara cedri]